VELEDADGALDRVDGEDAKDAEALGSASTVETVAVALDVCRGAEADVEGGGKDAVEDDSDEELSPDMATEEGFQTTKQPTKQRENKENKGNTYTHSQTPIERDRKKQRKNKEQAQGEEDEKLSLSLSLS